MHRHKREGEKKRNLKQLVKVSLQFQKHDYIIKSREEEKAYPFLKVYFGPNI